MRWILRRAARNVFSRSQPGMIETTRTKSLRAPENSGLVRLTGLALCAWVAAALLAQSCRAEDLITLDGKTYQNVRDLKAMGPSLVFSYGPQSGPSRTSVPFRNLSPDLQKKYGYDPFEVGLQNGGMASGIAGAMGKLGTMGLAAAIFSPWMNVSGSVLANYWRKKPVIDTVNGQLTNQPA